ncbi:MAG: hypothetical protein J5966_03425 [Lachnospiraceae bacterium]|nr:hypothetical protein [Lachnospiraceae bacterium]
MRSSDQTWRDMNMDQVFARINTCASLTGEDRLLEMLREPLMLTEHLGKPFSDEELKRRDGLIRYFDSRKEVAGAYRERLSEIGRDIKKPLRSTVGELEELETKSSLPHILCALFGCLAIAMIFVSPNAGLLLFLVSLAVNIPLYFKRKSEIGEYIACFAHIIKAYHAASSMLKVKDNEEMAYRRELKRAVKTLKPVVRGSFLLTAGRGLTGGMINMILDYLRIYFHIDLIKFNSMQRMVVGHRAEIERMFLCLGEIDVFIAAAQYRRSLPYWCVPEYTDGQEVIIRAERLCHPLLEKPVSSDIEASEKGVLITGSNASGKSTFLRSAALAAILGQSIATVYAESYTASRFYIVSSMAVTDDIMSGSSYYMSEIRALKQVIDICEEDCPVLCFVDEVLKGTNTIERIAASSEILKSLVRKNVICFAATHDIELTYMLRDYYDNYHFEEEIRDNEVSFSYRLVPGEAKSRNAIKLLRIMGYDDGITESAERRARFFEETGKWESL